VLVDTAISSYIHTSPGVEALVNEDSQTRCWCVSDDNPPQPPCPDLVLTQWGKAG
jgi:hypothetical protein